MEEGEPAFGRQNLLSFNKGEVEGRYKAGWGFGGICVFLLRVWQGILSGNISG